MIDEATKKEHEFRQERAKKDILLKLCKGQGYVKETCVLDGFVVWALVSDGKKPCKGCNLDHICGGKNA